MSLTIDASSFRAGMARAQVKMDLAVRTALYLEAESIMTDSRPLVPWETGVLKASGYVNRPVGDAMSASVEFGYGGAASAYAVIQEVHDEFNHPRGGQSRYFQTAFDQHAEGMQARLAERVRAAY